MDYFNYICMKISLYWFKLTISTLLINILYNNIAVAENCIEGVALSGYLLSIAQNEAVIAGIPGYKSGMLVDKGRKIDKVQLIQSYKKAHLQPLLNEEQINQIVELEKKKDKFVEENLCGN